MDKVLPWIGVCTSMSCHGHGLNGTHKIWFYGYYNSRWCEVLFDYLYADLEIARMWRFRHGPRKGDWASAEWDIHIPELSRFMALENPSDDYLIHSYRKVEEAIDRVDEQIQIMARRLFDPAVCERIRKVPQRADGVKDLARLLELELSS